jgi:hypothetical protein
MNIRLGLGTLVGTVVTGAATGLLLLVVVRRLGEGTITAYATVLLAVVTTVLAAYTAAFRP